MIFRWAYCLILASVCLFACKKQKKTDWRVTLGKEDKQPYGLYLTRQLLPDIFPEATISDLSQKFRYNNMDAGMTDTANGISLLFAAGLDFYLSRAEYEHLFSYIHSGNQVIIFARAIDSRLEQLLRVSIIHNRQEERPLNPIYDGTENEQILFMSDQSRKYGYTGRSVHARLEALPDSQITEHSSIMDAMQPDTLGFVNRSPNCLRFPIGKGHLTLHTAPLVLSNYFLLQHDNRRYLDDICATLPEGITRVYWNDYYKRSSKTSDLGILLQYPATSWAFIIALFALIIYIIFESKRRQRVIPEIKPPENSSVSFTETIGRLYYNKKDHNNLAEKMIQHFFEWVRTHYFIQTNRLDHHFTRQLLLKSGLPADTIDKLMEFIRMVVTERKEISEQELHQLYETIQQFYQNQEKQWNQKYQTEQNPD